MFTIETNKKFDKILSLFFRVHLKSLFRTNLFTSPATPKMLIYYNFSYIAKKCIFGKTTTSTWH